MFDTVELWQVALLFAVGTVAGVLNVLAGGGSLLTLPVLIFLGLPTAMANGTNRVAILVQNIVAVQGFRHRRMLPMKLALICTVPALVGSILGAKLAIDVSDEAFRRILAGVMIGVCVLMLVDPAKRLKFDPATLTRGRMAALALIFLGVGVYGGFIQAGVGFLIITGLLVHGLDMVRINAVKVFVVMVYTVAALVVFVRAGQVDWGLGLALALGNATGGWLGSQLAVSKGHEWLRRLVLLVAVAFAVRLLWR
ncbi:MAG: sulfite exporter TauE/SafE family protein [Candidatus Krumholzibacteria bacterium]|nr:sulfite exporter TauE/SafE family protein [Candidatus Krumholzibacteria bacterium]